MDDDTKKFLELRAESHNSRWGHIEHKFCEINVLKEIYKRNEYYCKLFSINTPRKKKEMFKRRIQDYMRVLRWGFIRDVMDTLVWEDLELLPKGHRMRSEHKISIYTEATSEQSLLKLDPNIDKILLEQMMAKMMEGKS